MKRNHPTTIDRNRKAIAGVSAHYVHTKTIVLDGVPHAPSDVVKILQDQIDAIDATVAARAAFLQASAAQKAASATANAVFLALKTRVFSDFKAHAQVVADFGVVAPSRRKPTPKTLVDAAAKREATRAEHRGSGARAQETNGAQAPSPTPVTH